MLRRFALTGLLAVGLTGALASTQSAQSAVVQAGANITIAQAVGTSEMRVRYYRYNYYQPYYGYNYYQPNYYQRRRPYYREYYRPRYDYNEQSPYNYYPYTNRMKTVRD